MDGPHVAKVAFKSTKNCLISVPPQWISPVHSANALVVFEVQYNGHQKAYFSWSGEYASAQMQNAGQWSVDINGFYALKLGFYEGQEVLVTRRTDPATVLESVQAEPVAVDDWEILEIHAAYVRDNLMNQVRVVWNHQLLPIWVNQSVCILVKISGLDPDCTIGMLEQLTDVIVAPKSRTDHRSDVRRPPEAEASSESPREVPVPDENPGKNWKIEGILGNVFGSWFEGKNAEIRECKKSTEWCAGLSGYSEHVPGSVILRVHPLDPADILEKFSEGDQSGSAETLLGSVDIRMLLSQPTTVVTLSSNFGFAPEQANGRRRPVVVGEIAKVRVHEEKSAENPTPKGEAEKKTRRKSAEDRPKRGHFVKVVLLDILWDYVKDSSADCSLMVSALGRRLTPGVALVQEAMRRQAGCGVTSRVRLGFRVREALRPTALTFYPLQSTVEKNSELSMEKSIRLWLHATSALTCPLVATDGALVEVKTDEGPKMSFILRSRDTASKDSGKGPLLVMPSTRIDLRMDTCVPDEVALTGSADLPLIGMKGAAWGGIAHNLHRGLLYLKTVLCLGPLSQQLRHPARPTPSGGGMLVCGVRGSGKTTLARALCRELYAAPHFVFAELVSCKTLKGKRVETVVGAWKKAYREARNRCPSIVVLDDLDALVGAPSGPENEVGGAANHQTRLAEALYDIVKSALVSETGRVVIVGTCKSVTALHKTLVSPQGVQLFRETLTIGAPDADQREEMLKRLVLSKPLLASRSLDAIAWRPLADRTEGFVAHDLDMIVDRAAHVSVATSGGVFRGSDLLLSDADFDRALEGFEPVSLRGLDLHPAGPKGWDDVGGLDEVKRALVETLQWPSKYPVLFAKCPLPMRSGVLLYGPPGTGKTLLAAVVAKECGMKFISVKGPELLSKYIGASEQAVRDLFEKASNASPCIIFFDEFDSLAPRRGHDSTGVTDRVVNQLLTQMDGVEGRRGVYVLAASSRPDLIDPALLRPGRLDKSLYCPLPLSEEREAILRALGRSMALSADVGWSAVAETCGHFSGADLQGLLYNAQLKAIRRTRGKGTERGGDSPQTPLSSADEGDQGFGDFVDVKDPEVNPEVSHPKGPKEDEDWTVVHVPRLEDGPVVLDAETSNAVRQQLDAISSSLYGCWTTGATGGRTAGSEPVVIVTHRDLMEAAAEMTPSVGPSDRQRYRDIYHKFIKSKSGQLQVDSSAAKRATLA